MNTKIILCLISFALSIDYSIGLIVLQAYWSRVHGQENLVGVIFGLYDGFVIIITPIVAWLLNMNYLKYKTVFVVGLILNLVGNIIYSLAYALNTWVFILIGRIVSGLGASILPLLVVYIALVMSTDEQKTAIGYVKYTSALTRVIGPIMGIVLALIKSENIYINEYTITGWIPAVICLIVLIVVMIWKEEEPLPIMSSGKPIEYSTIVKIFLPIASLGFITTAIYWYFMANGFVIATYRFHVIHNEHELGNIYYSGLGSFVAAFMLFIFFQELMSSIQVLWISSVLLVLTSTFFLWKINIMFYVAVSLATFCYAVLIPSVNIQNNLLAKKNASVLGNYMGVSIVALSIFQSVARFVGPSCFMLGKNILAGPNCNISIPEHYNISDCEITGYILSSAVSIGLSFFIMMISLCFILYNRRFDNTINFSVQTV